MGQNASHITAFSVKVENRNQTVFVSPDCEFFALSVSNRREDNDRKHFPGGVVRRFSCRPETSTSVRGPIVQFFRSFLGIRNDRGGHDVPAKDVARRFKRSLANLTIAFDIADRVLILDNTGKKHRLLLSIEHGRGKHLSKNIPDWAKMAIP